MHFFGKEYIIVVKAHTLDSGFLDEVLALSLIYSVTLARLFFSHYRENERIHKLARIK